METKNVADIKMTNERKELIHSALNAYEASLRRLLGNKQPKPVKDFYENQLKLVSTEREETNKQ